MDTYLVGGAVRDRLLGLEVTEHDFVVVGATPEAMLRLGYKPVGRDFPVFLHPDTSEEYALARTERKVGPGHQGFAFHASPDVTLEDDLLRRDLTINAIAEDTDGSLIDPRGGQADIKARKLRHVSDAFAEDPLRILRLARFHARFVHLGFSVAPETLALVQQMVDAKALTELSSERILGELNKALGTPDPAAFFRLLAEVGATEQLWPEITADAVDELAAREDLTDPEHRFVCLVHRADEAAITALCKRLRCSRQRTDLALLVARHQHLWRALAEADISDIMAVLKGTDAIRQPKRFAAFNFACAALLKAPDALPRRWDELASAAAAINSKDVDPDLEGRALGQAINEARAEKIKSLLRKG